MTDCLFCGIATKQQPSDVVFENEELLAFRDIHPKAPTHVLIVPKQHITSLAATTEDEAPLLGRLLFHAKKIAEQEGIDTTGYKVVINTGSHGGQVVDHLHIHVLGGEPLHWKV